MKHLFPSFTFKDVTAIDKKLFRKKKLLIFDIDNTLFYPESTDIRSDILSWFKRIQKKYRCICVSNSHTIRKRKETIEQILGVPLFLSSWKKPSSRLLAEIQKVYPFAPEEMLVIGDMRFTDILFGNRHKIPTILVTPLTKDELLSIRIIRKIENGIVRIVDQVSRKQKFL